MCRLQCPTTPHPNPYHLGWVKEARQPTFVNHEYSITFAIDPFGTDALQGSHFSKEEHFQAPSSISNLHLSHPDSNNNSLNSSPAQAAPMKQIELHPSKFNTICVVPPVHVSPQPKRTEAISHAQVLQQSTVTSVLQQGGHIQRFSTLSLFSLAESFAPGSRLKHSTSKRCFFNPNISKHMGPLADPEPTAARLGPTPKDKGPPLKVDTILVTA